MGEDMTLTGEGDATIHLQRAREPALVHVVGNTAGKHFSVNNYGPDGKWIDMLVSALEPYEGVRLIDFGDGEHTTRLQVAATGPWEIDIWTLTPERLRPRTLTVPGQFAGRGDEVVFLQGETPDILTVNGNSEGRFFAIIGYCTRPALLVNTTRPYLGMVVLEPEIRALSVRATGSWNLAVSSSEAEAR